MDSGELIDLFYNRAYEKFVNKQILDDKNYIVPRQQLKNYVHELVNIPYIDFINYIKRNQIEGEIKASDITQYSSFSACGVEMCNALIWANNPGCLYIDIGRFFPNNIIGRSDGAYRRYGESHIKAATQLGLTFEYYSYWYLSCLGYIFPEMDESVRRRFLARTITRNRLYQQLLVDIMHHDVNPEVYIDILPVYMIRKSLRSICTFLDICLETCKEENIKTYRLIKSYERFQTSAVMQLPPEVNDNLRNYLTNLDYKTLSYDTTIELIKKYKVGDRKANDILVKGYLKLVVTIAKRYMHRGLELEDLIQEGIFGLFKAFDHYNSNVNVGFCKYAGWWIIRSITQAVYSLSNIVQLPLNVLTLHRKIWKFVDKFEQEHEYPPSVDKIEINEDTGYDNLKLLYQLPSDLKEMTSFINDYDDLPDDTNMPDKEVISGSLRYEMLRLVYSLKDRERDILVVSYGLNGKEPKTLEEIADLFGLTRERVRQIRENAIRYLRIFLKVQKKKDIENISAVELIEKRWKTLRGSQFDSMDCINHEEKPLTIIQKTVVSKKKKLYNNANRNSSIIYDQLKESVKSCQLNGNSVISDNARVTILKILHDNNAPMTIEEIYAEANNKYFNWGVRKETIEYILTKMREVHCMLDGRFRLMSVSKGTPMKGSEHIPDSDIHKPLKDKVEARHGQEYKRTTFLDRLVKDRKISRKQLKQCHKKKLYTIGDVESVIRKYGITPTSTRFTKYTIDMWFGIVGLLNNNL